MGFTAMGFFFIFFPEEESNTITTKKTSKKTNISSLKSINNILNPSNSTHLFPKAQFIISICVLLIFTTFLFFTISTFEPSSTTALVGNSHSSSHVKDTVGASLRIRQHALQGMGTLYRKGTRSMSDLVVAHVVESVTVQELKLFTRLFYRSKMASKCDIVFVFQSESSLFDNVIVEENASFLKIIHGYSERFLNISSKETNSKSTNNNTPQSTNFDVSPFLITNKNANASEEPEPIWGRKKPVNFSVNDSTESSTPLSYGSVVGFYADELDPEGTLPGFMDHVPMSLRRWACYPLLLGRIRRNFKHTVLVDVKEMLLLDDPLSRVAKNLTHDSVVVNLTKTRSTQKRKASPSIIMGGSRGIRRLSNAMLIEIIRGSSTQPNKKKKKKMNLVTELTLFNQLVRNEFILKNVDVIFTELASQEAKDSSKSGSLI
ncbi:putative calcium-binding protein CML36-like [Capsicum annuum]|nr:putative calcium-binding protein CML36-like [Capsicum annuum]